MRTMVFLRTTLVSNFGIAEMQNRTTVHQLTSLARVLHVTTLKPSHSKLFHGISYFHTETASKLTDGDGNNNVVTALCNSFRDKRNWDTITRKFGSVELSDSLVERVLLELKNPGDAKAALGFFHWAAKRNNTFQHGLRSYCIAIHVLLGARLLLDARALLESLSKKNGETRTVRAVVDLLLETCRFVSDSRNLAVDMLIQCYAKMKMTDVAFDVCRYAEERGFAVSLVSFNALLHGVQKSDRCDMVWEVYEHMIRKRIYPNAVTLRIMIDALCKEGKLQENVDALDRIMGKRNSPSPSVIVNCSFVFRVLEKGHVAEENDIVVLLKRMLQKNLIPDMVAFSLILHAKIVLGNLDSTWEIYLEMAARGFQANSFVYTSFLAAFCREGRIGEAVSLMQEMERIGLRPYKETFDHLIVGCANSEQFEFCSVYFQKMLSSGIVLSCFSFNKMAEKLCERGEVEKVNDMFTVLLDKGFVPDDVTYVHLMQGYAKRNEIQEVLKLYYEMEYKSISPGLSVFETIIWSLCGCGKVEEAEKYLRIMKGRLITPTLTVYETLIAGHTKKGNNDRALHFQTEMASVELNLESC